MTIKHSSRSNDTRDMNLDFKYQFGICQHVDEIIKMGI